MSSEQVQFCYAIANGQVDRATQLLPRSKFLPERDVFQKGDFEFYSAIFCLSASQADSKSLHTNLKVLFPGQSEPTPDNLPIEQEQIRALLQELVYPKVKPALPTLLRSIVTLTRTSDTNRFFSTAIMALEAILHDPFFGDIEPRVRETTQKILSQLIRGNEVVEAAGKSTSSIRKQMTILHQLFSSPEFMEPRAPDLVLAKTYLPKRSSIQRNPYTLTDNDTRPTLGPNGKKKPHPTPH